MKKPATKLSKVYAGVVALIEAAKADDLKAKYPDLSEQVDQLAAADSTPTKKFLNWGVARLRNKESLLLVLEVIQKFEGVSHKLSKKDIGQYKTAEEALKAIQGAQSTQTKGDKARIAKDSTDVVYEDQRWLIVHPTTPEAAKKYGKGTRWCVAAIENNMFYDYATNNVSFFFLIDKTAEPKFEKDKPDFSRLAMMFKGGKPYVQEPFQDATNTAPRQLVVEDGIGKDFEKLYAKAASYAAGHPTNWVTTLLKGTTEEAIELFKKNRQHINKELEGRLWKRWDIRSLLINEALAAKDYKMLATKLSVGDSLHKIPTEDLQQVFLHTPVWGYGSVEDRSRDIPPEERLAILEEVLSRPDVSDSFIMLTVQTRPFDTRALKMVLDHKGADASIREAVFSNAAIPTAENLADVITDEQTLLYIVTNMDLRWTVGHNAVMNRNATTRVIDAHLDARYDKFSNLEPGEQDEWSSGALPWNVLLYNGSKVSEHWLRQVWRAISNPEPGKLKITTTDLGDGDSLIAKIAKLPSCPADVKKEIRERAPVSAAIKEPSHNMATAVSARDADLKNLQAAQDIYEKIQRALADGTAEKASYFDVQQREVVIDTRKFTGVPLTLHISPLNSDFYVDGSIHLHNPNVPDKIEGYDWFFDARRVLTDKKNRKVLVHEITHFVDAGRLGKERWKQSTKDYKSAEEDVVSYFNHPIETNARFQQGLDGVLEEYRAILRDIESGTGPDQVGSGDHQAAVWMLSDFSKMKLQDFYYAWAKHVPNHHLMTPDQRKRIKKRLYGSYKAVTDEAKKLLKELQDRGDPMAVDFVSVQGSVLHSVVSAAKVDDLKEKYPEFAEEIQELNDGDPTPQKKYLAWGVSFLRKGVEPGELVDLMRRFETSLSKLSKKDVFGYKTLDDLKKALEVAERAETGKGKDRAARGDAVVLYNDDRWLLVHPKTAEAAKKYGKGTRWCVAAEQDNKFFVYDGRNISIFFLIDKKAARAQEGSKDWSKLAMMFLNGVPHTRERFQDAMNTAPSLEEVEKNIEDFPRWYALVSEYAKKHPDTLPASLIRLAESGETDKAFKLYKKNAKAVGEDGIEMLWRADCPELKNRLVEDALATGDYDFIKYGPLVDARFAFPLPMISELTFLTTASLMRILDLNLTSNKNTRSAIVQALVSRPEVPDEFCIAEARNDKGVASWLSQARPASKKVYDALIEMERGDLLGLTYLLRTTTDDSIREKIRDRLAVEYDSRIEKANTNFELSFLSSLTNDERILEKIDAKREALKQAKKRVVSARRTAASRLLMFHGTASGPHGSTLRSILKQGMVPTAKKAWADDKDAREARQRSRASYGGTYFTSNFLTALSSVHRPRGQDKSQYPVIVTALLQPRSAMPDEDDYSFGIDAAYHYATQANDSERIDALYYTNRYMPQADFKQEEVYARFAEAIAKSLEREGALPKAGNLRKFTDPLFDAEVLRRVSNITRAQGAWYDFRHIVTTPAADSLRYQDSLDLETALERLPKELKEQPSYEEGEKAFRQALDALMKYTRKQAVGYEQMGEEGRPRFRHNLRVLEPVGFSGRNRILSVVSLPDYYARDTSEPTTVVVHFGDPSKVIEELAKQGYRDVTVLRPGQAALMKAALE